MNKLIDAALGIHPQALALGAKRIELLAGNIANADTPGFKARDIDFRATLEQAMQTTADRTGVSVARTHPGHGASVDPAIGAAPQYRIPNHPSLDGNTVDTQLEQAAFAEATVRYQASLDFIESRIEGLRKALRGE